MARPLTSSEVERIRCQMLKQVLAYRRALERTLKELESGIDEPQTGNE